MKQLLRNSQPILLGLEEKIGALTVQLQTAAAPNQPRGLGMMTSVVIDREIGNWSRFKNRRQVGSYTGLCPGEDSSGKTRLQSCVTKHGKPALKSGPGGTSLATGSFPARLPTCGEVASGLSQGSSRYGRRAQESDRGRSQTARRRSVADQDRAA